MTHHSHGLGLDSFVPFAEENLHIWHSSSYLGLSGDSTPLNGDDHLQHDTLLEGLLTISGFGDAVASTFESHPFFIDHDVNEPWPHMPIDAFHGVPDLQPQYGDSTEPKEPTTPGKATRGSSVDNKLRLTQKACHEDQHPSQPEWVSYQPFLSPIK